ncbi:C2 domain [Arabidopsis thaliana x Arabidopsis arenosa]|uniref:C2 domain n=1 Tax=Arabidopsis thaliana x Arabidopsis arenosa TaxID=1240361 RepID=A0A8T1ZSY9_9BRAS|nr:C2 domain [Arabidopsis thaliana x Arabidopsis arenosa]
MIYIGRSIDHHYTTMTKTLEIDLRSAEGLKLNRRPIKKKTLCVVSIDEKSRKSNLDESKRSNPTWNYKSEIPINGNVQFITIEVFYRTGSGHDKKIGEAKIPTKDFMGRYSPEGHLNFLSYRLRDEFGDKCGIVNLSILVKSDPTTATTAIRDYGACSSQAADTGLWRPRSETPSIDGYGGRTVTGVPVWGVYQRQF